MVVGCQGAYINLTVKGWDKRGDSNTRTVMAKGAGVEVDGCDLQTVVSMHSARIWWGWWGWRGWGKHAGQQQAGTWSPVLEANQTAVHKSGIGTQ